jgi:hypothetical protein
MTTTAASIIVLAANRGCSEGRAIFKGAVYGWMAYRVDDQQFRVMLSKDGDWIPRDRKHPLRSMILPIGRKAIIEASGISG